MVGEYLHALFVGDLAVQVIVALLHAHEQVHIVWRLRLVHHRHHGLRVRRKLRVKLSPLLVALPQKLEQDVVLLVLDIRGDGADDNLRINLRLRVVLFKQVVR